MPRSEAAARLEMASRRGHTVVQCRWSSTEDRAALEELAVFCGQFSPQVAHTTYSSAGSWTLADGLFLEITGTRHWFGGEESLVAQAIRAIAERWGYRACWGVADTPAAAWAWARYGPPEATTNPAGACLPPGNSWPQIKGLPIAALRLGETLEKTLIQLGIERIEQLAALPAASLRMRWGALPAERLAQLQGQLQELLQPIASPESWCVEQVLEYPTASRPQVEQVVAGLMGRLAERLAQKQLGALELVVWLGCRAAGCRLPMRIGLLEPTADVEHWRQLACMQFEQTPLPAAVTSLAVEAVRVGRLPVREGRLFGNSCSEAGAGRALADLVERLSARLGPQAVLRPYLAPDRQPEYAWAGRPYLEAAAGRGQAHCVQSRPTVARPLWLYQPPLPLHVMAVVPEGPPLRCQTARFQFTVARCWGPERIETGWWRGASVRRDYYRVEADDGRHFWIFRRLGDGRWFLQGEFV
ncbi:MAG: protein ImuB [Pirellulaceae bacterium]|nr:MAG: protein ImuB [Pirellulaceae bacterium]